MTIVQNKSLLAYNTFRIDVKADYFAEVTSEEDLLDLYANPLFKTEKILILGGGSNMLFTSDFRGMVVHIALKGIRYETLGDQVLVHALGGESWDGLVQYCIGKGFGGIENLSLIPGTAGASPVQNIGAYGVELGDILHKLRAFNTHNGEFREFSKGECRFSYRSSIFKEEVKNQFIITGISLNLSLKPVLHTHYGAIRAQLEQQKIMHPGINDIGRIVSALRISKLPDPSIIGNAGSFFKNPLIDEAEFRRLSALYPDLVFYASAESKFKLAAGWLIEQCGWKGKVIGHTGTWKDQALVLVNHGGASGKEILDLSALIIASVQEKFGIRIQPEVNIIY